MNANDIPHVHPNTALAILKVKDDLSLGKISAVKANVEIVKIERFRAIEGRLDREIRNALNDAVKRGELAHMKKDKFMSEVYYVPEFKYLADSYRNSQKKSSIEAISRIMC